MKKLMVVFGTRPELIKTACLIKELRKSKRFETVVCSTGQHKEMLEDLYDLFELRPDYDLNVMEENQTLSKLSSKVFQGIEEVIQKEKPDLVFVQGDTTSAVITAMVSFYNRVPVAHIEAGLRTGDKVYPYPEEINRRIISEIADFHFAPTTRALQNLEGYVGEKVQTGNTVVDAVEWMKKKLSLKVSYQNKVLVTVHRRESFGEPIKNICKAIKILAKKNPKTQFIFPVHPNPNVKPIVFKALGSLDNVKLVEPLRYDKLIRLLSQVKYILTDSGGIQEEACSFGKHVFVLRNETERMEGVASGVATLVGNNTNDIIKKVMQFKPSKIFDNPYGDGKASEKIIKIIEEYL